MLLHRISEVIAIVRFRVGDRNAIFTVCLEIAGGAIVSRPINADGLVSGYPYSVYRR